MKSMRKKIIGVTCTSFSTEMDITKSEGRNDYDSANTNNYRFSTPNYVEQLRPRQSLSPSCPSGVKIFFHIFYVGKRGRGSLSHDYFPEERVQQF